MSLGCIPDCRGASLKSKGKEITPESKEKLLLEMTDKYTKQTTSFYAASRLWVDAIIDPLDTRSIVSENLSAANNNPVTGVFNPKFAVENYIFHPVRLNGSSILFTALNNPSYHCRLCSGTDILSTLLLPSFAIQLPTAKQLNLNVESLGWALFLCVSCLNKLIKL